MDSIVINFISNKVDKLKQVIANTKNTSFISLQGGIESGKDDILKIVKSELENQYKIFDFNLENIETVDDFSIYYGSYLSFEIDRYNDLSVLEKLRMKLSKLLDSTKKSILILRNYNSKNKNVHDFFKDLFNYKIFKGQCSVIVDEVDYSSKKKCFDELYISMPSRPYVLKVGNITKSDVLEYLKISHKFQVDIDKISLERIYEASLHKYKILNMIDYTIISESNSLINNTLKIRDLSYNQLKDTVNKYIEKKLAVLKKFDLYEFVQKSTIYSNNLEIILEEGLFDEPNVDVKLQQISATTELIIEVENLFKFYNSMIKESIFDSITSENKKKWHENVARYYETLIQDISRNSYKITNINDYIKVVRLIYNNFSKANNISRSVFYAKKLSSLYFENAYYIKTLEILDELESFLEYQYYLTRNIVKLYRAEALYNLDNYEKAFKEFKKIQNSNFVNKNYVMYKLAYLYYFHFDNVEDSISLCNSIIDDIETQKWYTENNNTDVYKPKNTDIQSDISILTETYALLSCISELVQDNHHNLKSYKHYFDKSMKLATDYCLEELKYHFKRTAYRVIDDPELSLSEMNKAKIYFDNNSLLKQQAKVANDIGVLNIYNSDYQQAKTYLTKSLNIFESFASDLYHYPKNSLGVLEAHVNNNYPKAIEILESCMYSNIPIFSEYTISINLLNCYRKFNKNKYDSLFLKIKNKISNNKDEFALINAYILITDAIYKYENREYKKAYNILKTFFEKYQYKKNFFYNIYNTYASKLAHEISLILEYNLFEDAKKYYRNTEEFVNKLYDKKEFWVDFMFWE